MKRLLLILSLLIASACYGQNRSNVWELGYTFSSTTPKCELFYHNSIMDTSSVYRVMSFFITNSSICDVQGNLLFYTNGLTVANRNYDTLQNAVNFNPGWATDFYQTVGLGACQGTLILPDPGNSQRYYLFHESGEQFIAYNTYEVQPLHLSYSVIDMNLDGGFGGIVDTLKNKYAIVDTLLWGGLTAVKHANGRDWWIIAHRFYTDKYYKLLLTPEGIQGPFEQVIGSNLMYDVNVEASFSPDGSKYCISNHEGWFDYLQFDRCTGEFSDPVSVFIPDSLGFFGSSFSPNSRFIYGSSQLNLYQYDTWDPNMINDVVHIATWDSFYAPDPTWFFMHQLAPDGKIYISTWGGSYFLHEINSPDSLGLACNFSQHSFNFAYPHYNDNLPTFPNYDLGPLEGSPCDTLQGIPTLSQTVSNSSFSISPNPTTNYLNLTYQLTQPAQLEIFDVYGKRVAAESLYPYFKNRLLDVSRFPSGLYNAVVTQQGKKLWSSKVVVQ